MQLLELGRPGESAVERLTSFADIVRGLGHGRGAFLVLSALHNLGDGEMVGFGSEVHAGGLALPMLRVAPGATVDVEVLSDEAMHVGVHFLGRGLLCVGDGCPACLLSDARARTFVIVGSLAAANAAGTARGVWLLEMGTNRWPLDVRTESEARVAGSVLRLSRRKSRGVLFCEALANSQAPSAATFASHQLVSAVARVHGLPSRGELESQLGWEERVLVTARRLLAEAIERAR